mmetsp:Transcript_75732/g.195153  ORF Transcript_75732/g.195153 Transcript_75732/m.195153 type:complete len:214 (-) Transcript_75732:618-1259(-)
MLGLIDGAADVGVQHSAAVDPRGPRRQRPRGVGGALAAVLADAVLVDLHDPEVVLLLRRDLLVQCHLLLRQVPHLLTHGLVVFHRDHRINLLALSLQLLLGRLHAVILVLQVFLHGLVLRIQLTFLLPQALNRLLHAVEVLQDVEVLQVGLRGLVLVLLRALAQPLVLLLQRLVLLPQAVPLLLGLLKLLLQAGNLHLEPSHGLAHEGEALGL